MSFRKLGSKALKGALKISKKAANAIAIETKTKKPFATKTKSLSVPKNDTPGILTEIKSFAQIAQKIQELSKKSHFSYLEKLSRKFKDDCKVLFSKIQAEKQAQNQNPQLDTIQHLYKAKRGEFLNKTHAISKNISLICTNIESSFQNFLNHQNQNEQNENINNDTLQKFLSQLNK